MASQVLGSTPVLKPVFEVIPGSSAAAFRPYNLAGVTAQACSPVEDGA